MEGRDSKPKHDLHLLAVLLIIGALLRFVLSALSYGTNDIDSWYRFADAIGSVGLLELYRTDSLFNHPPLMGFYAYASLTIADFLGAPFPFCFRLLPVLADLLSVVVIFKLSRLTSGSIFQKGFVAATAPVLILISGYHGNTDPIYTSLVLSATYLAMRFEKPLLVGLVFGLACNVKIIPILLAPAFFFFFLRKGGVSRFLLGFLFGIIPFLMLLAVGGLAPFKNILLYSSFPGYWGVQMFLLLFKSNFTDFATQLDFLSAAYQGAGKFLLVLVLVPLAYVCNRRTENLPVTLAVSYGVFAVIAPGFAIQYLALVTALFLCVSTKWGLWTGVWSGALALSSYLSFMVSVSPLRSVHTASEPKFVVLFAFFAWLCVLLATVDCVRKYLLTTRG